MIITSYVFGEVFSYDGNEYIFLASTAAQLYTAKILNKELTKEIETGYKRALKSNNLIRQNALVYCYVILKTEDFVGQIASLAKTENTNFDMLSKKSKVYLCQEDLLALKREILESRSVPIKLQELVSELALE